MSKYLFTGTDWNPKLIESVYEACEEIAEELKLDYYPNRFEIITSEQMLDAYTSIGMPLSYTHWSYGKQFVSEEHKYRSGQGGLAYELVVNTNPCINYLMEDNTATIQALVIAHAAFGHNHFFKNNYLFKMWTDADAIVDYLEFAKKYIRSCEEKYGEEAVEAILDSAHALKDLGIDKYKRPPKLSAEKEMEYAKEKAEFLQQSVNELWNSVIFKSKEEEKEAAQEKKRFPAEPQENVLKFLEKHSQVLEPWQREIVRIVRCISQYFYPQRQTKVMNEGFACWTHMYMMNRLYDKGLIDDGTMIEFTKVHSNVVMQPGFDSPYFSGMLNPYALGLEMFNDIERMCKNPTDEDREWFPEIVGQNHVDVILDAVANYRDESFISQYLSPNLIRKFKLFRIEDHDDDFYEVTSIHNKRGYEKIIKALASNYNVARYMPDIQVYDANMSGDRSLELRHYSVTGETLDEPTALETLKHLKRLWGFDPFINSFNKRGELIDEIFLLGKNGK